MPCYNNAALLSASVHSVLQQDYPNIELIVVDDGSTDNSIAVLQSFGDKISIIQQKNQGPAAARNHAITLSSSPLIAVLDADGTIVAVNRAWREFGQRNGATGNSASSLGLNYLEVCRAGPDQAQALQAS